MYFVLGDRNVKYGPADMDTLRAWVAEGRILPGTKLERQVDGAIVEASSVTGLFPVVSNELPPVQAAPAGFEVSATVSYPRPAAEDKGAKTMGITAWVLGTLSLLTCAPICLGPIGIGLGIVAKSRGYALGNWAAIFCAVGLVVGSAVNLIVALNNPEFQRLLESLTKNQ